METTNDYVIEVDHLSKCFIWKQDGTYESEHFDNRLNLFEKINQIIDEFDISEDNSIFLLERLLETFLPNFPKNYKKAKEDDDEGYFNECDFITEIYFTISEMKTNKIISTAESIPFLKVFGEGKNCWGNIYFECSVDEDNDDENRSFINYVSITSKKEGYNWVGNHQNKCIMDVMEKQNLIDQIENSNLPENPNLSLMKKGTFPFQLEKN